MKKLSVSLLLVGSLLALVGCEEKNLTIYDYLQNEALLNKTLDECISGALNDEHKCETVKRAYANLDLFKNGAYTEDELRSFGKK
ncbi:EexN family lipoprotein [Aggregatibacter actinomycetemcomitans]|uniref:EexN family lipoprotein n=1 Tax=Aggregatibacter actinomycetemcomitans TaxID=714 RepID=UPI00197B53EF|nr:EexN family lipoprotein [Aggregatibacter actinomycetemcomitans]MBN6064070.1 EexN family lipoprotein [Aggregatibacter actinomycetemcomitans]MBN6081650.1 EexN family lipoprotein [Aggregatibacter actinomycetemcomitans]MBN6083971.1 EexN family lipoprotein [Aggregatibacter actinomycetemcomitans]